MNSSTDWFAFAMMMRPYFMVWVVLLLAGILYWSLRPRRSNQLEHASRIPFNEDDVRH